MPFLDVNGQKTYYAGDCSRAGIPVIFCHGSGGSHHHWIFQLRGLPAKVNPLAVDLPGHGRSEGSPFNTVALYGEWLHSFAIATGLDTFIAAGHSLGGAIVLHCALNYPNQISGLILVGTGSRLRVMPAFLDALREGTLPPVFCDFLYGSAASDQLRERGREEALAVEASTYLADLSACDDFDVSSELPGITKPALIVCGSEDRLTPVKYSLYLTEKLFRSKIEIFEGAGHMVMLEKPEEVNRAIASFIWELQTGS